MAKLAESIVQEWLNRLGFFSIQGVKEGVHEIDLLAVRPESDGAITGWHVEAQVSFRPVAYIAGPTNAKRRSPQEMEERVNDWVRKKYLAGNKEALRRHLWQSANWQFHFVHGVVRYPAELDLIRARGIALHSFEEVLSHLCDQAERRFVGSAGGDLAEIVDFYQRIKRAL